MSEYIDSTFVRPSATECHPAWIGLHDRDREAAFTWTDGSDTPYTNWWGSTLRVA